MRAIKNAKHLIFEVSFSPPGVEPTNESIKLTIATPAKNIKAKIDPPTGIKASSRYIQNGKKCKLSNM